MRKNIKGVTPTADEQAECRRDVPPGIETTAKPVKNWQRFNSREEAIRTQQKLKDKFPGCFVIKLEAK